MRSKHRSLDRIIGEEELKKVKQMLDGDID